MFFKISILKNFAIFTGKRLCCSLFLIKLQAFWPKPLLKRDSYFIKHLRRLLLSILLSFQNFVYLIHVLQHKQNFFFVFKKNSEFSDSQFLWWVIKRLRVFKQVKENGCCYRQISLDQDILKAWWILGLKFIHWGTLWWYITLILIFIGDNEMLNKIYFSNIKEKRLFLSLICIFTF